MKNIKNTIAATALAMVMGFGATTANAGLLMSDRNGQPTCGGSGGIISELTGILIVGATSSATGILIVGRTGLMMSDRSGLLMSDKANGCSTQGRDGLLMSD